MQLYVIIRDSDDCFKIQWRGGGILLPVDIWCKSLKVYILE